MFAIGRMRRKKHTLPRGAELDQYVVEKTLGGGGFSLVYLARDTQTGKHVAIKEYMPQRLAKRARDKSVTARRGGDADRFQHGRSLFLQEAKTLANLDHPNIVRVLNFFQANGTVYMVMAYEPGKNLQHYIQQRSGRLSERFLRTVFPPLLQGLKAIHQESLLHLDIKPSNIHLRPGGRPILFDFGAVHRTHMSRRHQPTQVISAGYSPIEQYERRGYVGPWTDLYAIGATMRSCIEGKPPPPAIDRREHEILRPAAELYKKHYSLHLLEAIDWAMEVDPLLRPQSVDALLSALRGEAPAGAEAPARQPGVSDGSTGGMP